MIDWRKIGGNGKNGSWTGAGTGEPESIYRLVTFNNKLYASTVNFDSSCAAEVWEFSSSTWTKIGGDGVNNSWDSAPEHEFADALTVFNDKLYVGLGFDNNDGEVWEWTSPTSWTKIGGDGTGTSWATSVRVRDIISYTNPGGYTALYAGKGATNDAEVWRYSATSTAWEVIAGNGENGSWSANEYNIVRDFFVMDWLLYVSTAEDLGDADVWEYNGSTWTQIGGDSINSSWDGATHPAVTQLGSFNGKLYANTGTGAAAEIWEWTSPTDWTQVGGGGVNGSWTNNELSETLPLVEYRGQFYVGLHDNESVSPTHYAEVWRWPGTGDWAKVAGGGVHNSWQDDIADVVGGLVEFDGKLIAGFGLLTPNQFGAQVWEMRIGPISYENSSKTLVINATTTLPAGSTLIIENLGFGNFTATHSASTTIRLCADGSCDATAATDDKTKTINAAAPASITLFGTLFGMDETTPMTGVSKTIKIAIGTSTPGVFATTTTSGNGTWSIASLPQPFIGERFLAWVAGDTTFRAATFTKGSSTANDITGIDLYQNRVTIKHEGFTGTSTTNSDLAFYDATDDGDIQFDATAGGALAVNSREELHIAPGTEFAPGGNVTLHGQASTTNPDGDLHLASGARQDGAATSSILTMTANTLKLAGNWFASSTSKFISSASTYFNATTTGKTIFATTTPFTNLYFTGTGGGWTIMGSSTVTNTLAVTTTNMALSFGAYATSTVNNLEHNGQNSGTPLVLRSSVTGSPWGLAPTGTQSVSYVDVKDSNACLGLNLIATNGTNVDAGGNYCWEFSTGTLFKQGSFFKKTSTGNQSIAGVGFQPKALIFYWTRQAKPGFNATSSIGIGFVSGTSNERAISWTEEDNAATSVTGLRVSESRAIILLSQSTPVLGSQAELASMDSDGFTLNWTDNDSQATLLNYVAIGGSGVDAWAGSFTASTTGAAQAPSTLNFNPDTVFFIPTVTTAFLDSNQSSTYTHGIGLASSPSELGTINVASANGDTTNAQKVSQQLTSASFNRNAPSGVQESLGSLSSMNPDGFTFTWSDNPSGEIEVFFLAIGGANMKVGSFDQPTVSGNQSVTGTGFKPSGVMFFI